ncbi:Protein kinase-like domain [Phytophthora cactorum]|nr:Protein kinase-like domain [Phytophthora cactorum]
MAGRMDLEARLRALREGNDLRRHHQLPSTCSDAASFSWPEVPSNLVKKEIPGANPSESLLFLGCSTCGHYESLIFGRFCAFCEFSYACGASKAAEPAPDQEEVLRLTATQLLGPDYEEAVKMLIEIGRRQAAPHLQDIVKAKALALLQRAEGLSEWTNEVLAKDSSQQALAAAYHQSQQNRYRSLTEKQELVSKMQQDNRNMKARLNQLALLTKIRGRMMKVVKKRRARKAAEAEAAAQATRDIMSSRGEAMKDQITSLDLAQMKTKSLVILLPSIIAAIFPATHGSPREEQKVDLINELHNRIGLPQIDHLRKFEPLTSDPRADTKQEELQSELETAKQEADKLRAAKAQEFAEVQSELDRVREELEVERRRSASLHSGPSSWRSSVASDPGTDESQDTGVMQNLRLSLHKVFRGRDEQPGEGSFGSVFLMREKKLGGRLVCVKEIYRAHYPKRSAFASRAKSVDVEVDLMKKLRHPNLIRLLSSFVGPSPLRQPHIVMEYCSGGDLRTYLKTHKMQRSCLDEDKIWYWFVQLALGLHHMHQQRVLHRDLKTANIFF